MTVAVEQLVYAQVTAQIIAHGNILPDNGVGVVGAVTGHAITTAMITMPWPPEPQEVILTESARSDTELTNVAAAQTSLTHLAKSRTRLT